MLLILYFCGCITTQTRRKFLNSNRYRKNFSHEWEKTSFWQEQWNFLFMLPSYNHTRQIKSFNFRTHVQRKFPSFSFSFSKNCVGLKSTIIVAAVMVEWQFFFHSVLFFLFMKKYFFLNHNMSLMHVCVNHSYKNFTLICNNP